MHSRSEGLTTDAQIEICQKMEIQSMNRFVDEAKVADPAGVLLEDIRRITNRTVHVSQGRFVYRFLTDFSIGS